MSWSSSKQVRTTRRTENGKTTTTTTTTITTVNGVTKEETVTKTENADGEIEEISLNHFNNDDNDFWSRKKEMKNSSTNVGGIDEERVKILNGINSYRRQHRVPSLRLDDSMNDYAQEWANHLATIGRLTHRPAGQQKYGENLACGYGAANFDWVENWYKGYHNYDFNRPGFSLNTGHFTQLVWKSSQRLGVGMQRNASGDIFVVTNYGPAGNWEGCFEQNVFDKK